MKYVRALDNQTVLGITFGCLFATAICYVVEYDIGFLVCCASGLLFSILGILKCFGRC